MSKEGIQGLALGRKDILRIDPRNLQIRPDWNCRDVNFNPADADDISLAESIAAVGVKQPLTAVWEQGQAWLTDGHRRLGAGTICTARVKFARSVSEMAFGSRFIFCVGSLQ